MAGEVSFVVVTYNSASSVGDALSSFMSLPAGETPREIVVVDNASADGSADAASAFDGVKVVRNRRNTGLARANNLGASFCTAPNLFFLNPDVVLHPGAVTTLMEFAASNPRAGLIGPGMVDAGGLRQSSARTFPTPVDLLLRRTLLGRLPLSRQRLDRHLNPVSGILPSRADWLVGAALFCTEAGRRRFGLMSNRYFLYFEDVEWCWRAWAAGMEVWHHPGAVITHVCRRESARLAGRAAWLHFVSMFRFFSEHPEAIGGRRPGKA